MQHREVANICDSQINNLHNPNYLVQLKYSSSDDVV